MEQQKMREDADRQIDLRRWEREARVRQADGRAGMIVPVEVILELFDRLTKVQARIMTLQGDLARYRQSMPATASEGAYQEWMARRRR